MSRKEKRHQWQIDRDEDIATERTFVAMIRDAPLEHLVELARDFFPLYDAAVVAEDEAGGRELRCFWSALVSTAFDHGLWGTASGFGHREARHLERFDCYRSAERWLQEQTASPLGTLPFWGQSGRFLIEVEGCKVDVHVGGMGWGDSSLNVVELDRPFLSETGFLSMCAIGQRAWGYSVADYWTLAARAVIWTGRDGKRLKRPGLVMLGERLHPKRGESYAEWIANAREQDPAYQPGGFLHAYATKSKPRFKEDRSGQFLLFA